MIWVRADEKSISTGAIVAIVIVPIILLALGFGIWRKRKSYKAFTTESEFPRVFVQRQIFKTQVDSIRFLLFYVLVRRLFLCCKEINKDLQYCTAR